MTRKLSQKSAAKRARLRYANDPAYRENTLQRNAKWWANEYASDDPFRIQRRKERQRKASRKFREDHREEDRAYKREYWRKKVAKIALQELKEFRAKPALADKYMQQTGLVPCFECGASLKTLGRHPLQWRGIRSYEYRAKWPHAPRVNSHYRADLSERGKRFAGGAYKPRAKRGRPQGTEGRVWSDTEEKIMLFALLLRRMSKRQIALRAPLNLAESSIKSFLKRHKVDIARKRMELASLSELELIAMETKLGVKNL